MQEVTPHCSRRGLFKIRVNNPLRKDAAGHRLFTGAAGVFRHYRYHCRSVAMTAPAFAFLPMRYVCRGAILTLQAPYCTTPASRV